MADAYWIHEWYERYEVNKDGKALNMAIEEAIKMMPASKVVLGCGVKS